MGINEGKTQNLISLLVNQKALAVCTTRASFGVLEEGIEPPTQGFSVLCSTN